MNTTGLSFRNRRSLWLCTGLVFTLSLLCYPSSCLPDLRDGTYDALFKQNAQRFLPQYDWHWVKAQSYQESRFNPAAVSPAGAVGLMQVMPATGRMLARVTGVSGPLTSPTVNVMYGAAYMQRMVHIWRAPRTDEERLELAHASYNAGPGNIIKAQELAGGVARWSEMEHALPLVTGRHAAETRGYVRQIRRWKMELAR